MKKKNLKTVLKEEIALEGLDGITFQALWIRLSEATGTKTIFTNSFKEYIWKLIKLLPYIQYYELEEPRKDLIPFDRWKDKVVPEDIYPHVPILDTKNNVQGSCSTYHTRMNITEVVKTMNFEQVFNKYGSRLVMVASQKTREEVLFDCKGNFLNMSVVKYCMLERIGRSRYNGEISHGKNSLLALGEDPKSLFYYRKSLLELNVIKKQTYSVRSENNSYNGTLLHLTRFYKVDKPKYIKLTEMIVNMLKKKPNNWAIYEEIRALMKFQHFKKLVQSEIFQEYVKTDVSIPYRSYYPDATPEEYQCKHNKAKEKNIKVIQLKNPNAVVKFSKKPPKRYHNQTKHTPFVKTSLNQSYLNLVCHAVRSFGGKGCSELEVKNKLGLPRLITRLLIRNLLRKKLILTFLVDDGRQRLNKYCYKEFEKDGEMAQIVKNQRKATLELLLDDKSSSDEASIDA